MAMNDPNEVATTKREESAVNLSAEQPVPSEVGKASERYVENVFCRLGTISPPRCVDKRINACLEAVTAGSKQAHLLKLEQLRFVQIRDSEPLSIA